MRRPTPNLRTARFLSTIADERRKKRRIEKKKQQKKKRSSSSCPIELLSHDLMLSILSRLPPKYLLRSQLVSKSWRSLIADAVIPRSLPTAVVGFFYHPRVVRLSDKIVAKPATLPIFQPIGTTPVHSIKQDSLPLEANLKVVDCCNGLLLCHSSGRVRHKAVVYYVCNPATKMWHRLPKPPRQSLLYLAFDPLFSPHYKVLCLRLQRIDLFRVNESQILTSETRQWGETARWFGQQVIDQFSIGGRQHSTFCKGFLYVATQHVILRFSFRGKQPKEIRFPSRAMKPGMGTSIGRLAGTVCYAVLCGASIRIWTLEGSDNNGWVLKHRHMIKELEQLRPEGGNKWSKVHILAFHPHEEVVFILMRNRVLSYDLNSMELKDVCKLQSDGYEAFDVTGFPFSPCFFDVFND